MSTLPDAPPIARLRQAAELDSILWAVCRRSDLRYALARIDESCAGCFVIDAVKQQGQTIDRLYALIDILMADKRARPTTGTDDALGCGGPSTPEGDPSMSALKQSSEAPGVPVCPSSAVVTLCTPACPFCPDDWADQGIGG